MNEQVEAYLEKYPQEIITLFHTLREMILESTSAQLREHLWARLPSYEVNDSFVRLIPFKDHINIEAKAAAQHRHELAGYRMTPKGMLQIFVNQEIPVDVLRRIFAETLGEREERILTGG